MKKSTLQSRVKTLLKKKSLEELLNNVDYSGNESPDENSRIQQFGNKYTNRQVFALEQEEQLCCYIKKMFEFKL